MAPGRQAMRGAGAFDRTNPKTTPRRGHHATDPVRLTVSPFAGFRRTPWGGEQPAKTGGDRPADRPHAWGRPHAWRCCIRSVESQNARAWPQRQTAPTGRVKTGSPEAIMARARLVKTGSPHVIMDRVGSTSPNTWTPQHAAARPPVRCRKPNASAAEHTARPLSQEALRRGPTLDIGGLDTGLPA